MRCLILAAVCILSVQAGRYGGVGMGGMGGGMSEGEEYGRDRHVGESGGYNDLGYGSSGGSESHNFGSDQHDFKQITEDHSSHVHDVGHENHFSTGGHLNSGHHNFGEGSSAHGSRFHRVGGGEGGMGIGY